MTDLDVIDAKILRLKPGDIIALRHPHELSPEQAAHFQEWAEAAFPGHTVVVLAGGVDVVVVREPEPL